MAWLYAAPCMCDAGSTHSLLSLPLIGRHADALDAAAVSLDNCTTADVRKDATLRLYHFFMTSCAETHDASARAQV